MYDELTLLTELDRLLVSFLEENGERDRRLRTKATQSKGRTAFKFRQLTVVVSSDTDGESCGQTCIAV